MTPEEQKTVDAKTVADKVAADKKEADRVAAANKAEADAKNQQPLVVEGDAVLGGPFTIYGTGFGTQGVLKVAGQIIKTTRWTDHSIKGSMPAGLKGDVELSIASGVRHGKWPYVRPTVTKTTTTTVETVPTAK